MNIIELIERDLLPSLELTWQDSGDVTGYEFRLHVRREKGGVITRIGVIEDDGILSGSARVSFAWQPGDLVAGRHEAEIEVWNPEMKNETWAGLLLDVEKDIA